MVSRSSMSSSLLLLLPVLLACPPTPNGCYAGVYDAGQPYITNQQCPEGGQRDWCAVTYQPQSNRASFGCANNFQVGLQLPTCGLGIDNSGCTTHETANGPCLLCCCRGGSCNHPTTFMRQAQQQYPTYFSPNNPIQMYDSSSKISVLVSLLVLQLINL